MKQVTVVFPMAGEGQRFGGKFKPFLKIFDKTFIELAVQPFLKHKKFIKEIIFIVREDHYTQFDVKHRFINFNLPIEYSVHIINPTGSPIETINSWMGYRSQINDVIFCDCDHSLNVDHVFGVIIASNFDSILPIWPVNQNDANKWSIVNHNDKGKVFAIKEKEYPENIASNFSGVIGCYYFKSYEKASIGERYISEVISKMISEGKSILALPIHEADFFGDTERLNKLYAEKKASTIFCDLDGTIIKHESTPDYSIGIELLEGSIEKINEWRVNNAFIVLTTARDEQFRPEMEGMLRKSGIRYEYLIMGLPSGPRYLINDKKPYSDALMAKSFEVTRDKGIKDVQLGHSFAKYSQKENVSYKTIPSDSGEYQKKKLRSQYDSMLSVYNNPELSHLVPAIYDFKDHSYGMEYLEGYEGLHKTGDKKLVLQGLFIGLGGLYKDRSEYPTNWLRSYLEEKIFSKREVIKELGLNADDIFHKLENITTKEYKLLSPTFLSSTIHGDLTYENIMVKGGSIKLIDFDNDNVPAPIEQDLGKLFQSAYCQYEHWSANMEFPAEVSECQYILDFYEGILNIDSVQVYRKAIFYCSLHLIRMIPYQSKRDINRAKKALDFCNKLLKQI